MQKCSLRGTPVESDFIVSFFLSVGSSRKKWHFFLKLPGNVPQNLVKRFLEKKKQKQWSVLKQWGEGGALIPLFVFSKMSFPLFVCTNTLLCDVYKVQLVRNRLTTIQEEAAV